MRSRRQILDLLVAERQGVRFTLQRSFGLPLLLLSFLGLLPVRGVAIPQVGSNTGQSQAKKHATPLRLSEEARRGIVAKDKDLVKALDRAWCTGTPRDVVKLVRSPSRPAWFELLARVRASQMAGTCVRESRILSKEIQGPYRALLLATTFGYPGSAGHQKSPPVQTYELLIYKQEVDGEARAIYLVETSLDALAHVRGRLADGSGPWSGVSISKSASYSCIACNYRLSLPKDGDWMIVARPSADSGLLECVELLSLEEDLSLELSIIPVHRTGLDSNQRKQRLLGFLDEGIKVLESCSGKVASGSKRTPVDLFGLMGWSQTILLRDTRMGRRFYRLYGLNGASLDYMVSVQGSMDQLENKDRLASLDHCFQLLDPDRNDEEAFEIIHRLHGEGYFKGNHYIVKKLGLDLTGPEGWNRFTQVGNARFMGGFDCKRSGSVIYLSAVDRPGGHWDKKSTAAWAAEWIDREKKMHQGFHNGALTDVNVSDQKGFEFAFDYPMPRKEKSRRARGFLTLFPRESTLIVVMGVALPVAQQKQIMAQLTSSLGSLRFE